MLIRHILVADVPKDEDLDGDAEMSTDDIPCTPNASYYNSLQGVRAVLLKNLNFYFVVYLLV